MGLDITLASILAFSLPLEAWLPRTLPLKETLLMFLFAWWPSSPPQSGGSGGFFVSVGGDRGAVKVKSIIYKPW
jgi:hypothetical protein